MEQMDDWCREQIEAIEQAVRNEELHPLAAQRRYYRIEDDYCRYLLANIQQRSQQ